MGSTKQQKCFVFENLVNVHEMHLQEDMHLMLGINSTFQYLCRCLIYSVPHPMKTVE